MTHLHKFVQHGADTNPKNDPRIETIIRNITEELKKAPEAVGAILHGSYARGTARADSDMDFLCVLDTTWMDKEIRIVDGIEVEIQRMPLSNLSDDIEGAQPKPFTVASLMDCRILFDSDGQVAKLREKAQERWKKGPPNAPLPEVLFGKSYLRHHLEEIDRLQQSGLKGRIPLEATIYQTFLAGIRAFFRARNLWLLKISDSLADIENIDPEFAGLVKDYVGTEALDSRIELLKEIVEYAIRPLGTTKVEYKTPRISAANLPGAASLLI